MTQIFVSQVTGAVPVTVLRIEGDLMAEEPLRSQAEMAYKAGTRYMLLDLSDVTYISSSGLRAIHYVFDMLRANADTTVVRQGIADGSYKSPHLKLLNPTQTAVKALKVSGYDMFLEIHQNQETAVASFG